jgi:hypothetical protein
MASLRSSLSEVGSLYLTNLFNTADLTLLATFWHNVASSK